MLHTTGYHTH